MEPQLTMTDFKPIDIQDKPLFDEFLRKDPPQISDLTFTNLFIWGHHYQPAWLEWNECILIIYHPRAGSPYGLCPFGPGDKKRALIISARKRRNGLRRSGFAEWGRSLSKAT